MPRLLLAVVMIAVLGFIAYRTMYGSAKVIADHPPTERLQNAREAAKRIEGQQDQRTVDADKAADGDKSGQ